MNADAYRRSFGNSSPVGIDRRIVPCLNGVQGTTIWEDGAVSNRIALPHETTAE